MNSQGNVPTFARIRQLFGYETGGLVSPIWAKKNNYPFFVLANREGPIHSGIGFLQEQGLQTYFKFIELI
jgi:hypothetical protein